VDAIRQVDMKTAIYVEGTVWANVTNWSQNNALLDIKDPADKIVYEAHLYFDKYMSGTYQGTYDSEGAYADMGAARIADFVQWLEAKGAKGFIGEIAVPDTDPRWLTVLDNALAAIGNAGLDAAYWGAGPWWGDYPLALRNADGSASAQLDILTKHVQLEATAAALEAAKASVPALESAVTPETSPPKVCSCKVARMPAVDQVTSALELPMVPLLPAEGCKLMSFTFA
jgi:hypothetical protein